MGELSREVQVSPPELGEGRRVSRSTLYRAGSDEAVEPTAPQKRGPKTRISDAELLAGIRQVRAESDVGGEGHRKATFRLRSKGTRVGKHRVLRVTREHGLLVPVRQGHPRGTGVTAGGSPWMPRTVVEPVDAESGRNGVQHRRRRTPFPSVPPAPQRCRASSSWKAGWSRTGAQEYRVERLSTVTRVELSRRGSSCATAPSTSPSSA